MPTIYTPTGVMVELVYTYGSQRVENVYHVTKGSPASLADLQALWTVFKDWENVTGKLWRSTSATLVLIMLTALDNAAAPYYEAAPNPVISGSNATGAVIGVVSVAVKHSTSGLGRSKRGRTYHVGLGANTIATPDTLTTAAAAGLAAMYNTLRTVLATAGWTFVINSKYSGVEIVNGRRRAIPRAAGVMQAILGSTCEIGLDTQRHRKAPYQV